MKTDKFQRKIQDLVKYDKDANPMMALWLCEEAGEVGKVVKHALKEKLPLDDANMQEELGDTLTCLTILASINGYSLDDIASAAVDKLTGRMAEKQ